MRERFIYADPLSEQINATYRCKTGIHILLGRTRMAAMMAYLMTN